MNSEYQTPHPDPRVSNACIESSSGVHVLSISRTNNCFLCFEYDTLLKILVKRDNMQRNKKHH